MNASRDLHAPPPDGWLYPNPHAQLLCYFCGGIGNVRLRPFKRAYTYAMQAYDTAMLIDSAIKATGGKLTDRDALRAALKKADFVSLRGDFEFNVNNYPIQDFYLVKVAKRADGKYETEIAERVFKDYADSYAKDCPLK